FVADVPAGRPLGVLLGANAISLAGNAIAALAVPWFVLQTTGSATQTGIVGFFAILPVVLSSFFGGGLVDRLGYKRASIIADVASGLTVAAIPALHAIGALTFPVLLALAFLGALLDAPGATARRALLPELSARAGWPLERATSAAQVAERGARLIGAPAAGLLVALFGPSEVLWIDAASFAISALMVALLVPGPGPAPAPQRAGYMRELLEGLRFIRGDAPIAAILLVLLVTNFLDSAWFAVTAPVYAEEMYRSAAALGLLFGATAGGSVAGALVYGAFGVRWPRRPVFVADFVVAASQLILLAMFPPLWAAVAICALAGFGAGPLNPIIAAVSLERIPPLARGRVLGALTGVGFLAMPLGALVAGPLLTAVGLRTVLLLAGGLYLLTTLSLVANPAIRAMDDRRDPTAAAPRA
ncbi:MAG: MFS transporter, partial [Thermomicrobiales bacterium]|nr:MFS transporter [Thermomicrobiales bacterium]